MSRLGKDINSGVEMTLMRPHLRFSSGGIVPISKSSTYPGMYQISGCNFYIDEDKLQPHEKNIFEMSRDGIDFEKFYCSWIKNEASWFRGFNCSHFSYPAMLNGKLASEGNDDIPSFSMTKGVKTRWLPGCFIHDLCTTAAISNTDEFTDVLSSGKHVPVAIVVKVKLGKDIPIPVAWLNVGEQVIRGPLNGPAFSFESIVWLCLKMPKVTNFPPNLPPPPPRPYNPSGQLVIDKWWNEQGKPWVDSVDLVGGYQCFLKQK
ncbi:hypothetical protein [Dyella choica]|uniref:Uncharacterized protein n=1 Tax=Dyella choica TaxID=1927959 RepID=A0A432M7N8_9GAMM|nr:hypothetical protein [Dyella choica]RUL77497.1 hypothetical protein EKH80_06290 [Dyella choica]